MSLDKKILKRSDAAELGRALRSQHKIIVFTNGCFDIIHRGHVEYLEFAKSQGDVLIVGLNTDESVRRLKGQGRPINSWIDRAYVLAALRSVDYVIPFHEDTPLNLIKEIVPDVLVKGADYKPEEVVGADFVKSHGGKLILAQFRQGYSTTKIIERICVSLCGSSKDP